MFSSSISNTFFLIILFLKNINIKLIFRKQLKTNKDDSSLDTEAAKLLNMHGGGEKLDFEKVQDLVIKYFKKADDVIH